MRFKILAATVASLLLLVYLGSIVVKLKEVPLAVVVVIGLGLMARDLWESLRDNDH